MSQLHKMEPHTKKAAWLVVGLIIVPAWIAVAYVEEDYIRQQFSPVKAVPVTKKSSVDSEEELVSFADIYGNRDLGSEFAKVVLTSGVELPDKQWQYDVKIITPDHEGSEEVRVLADQEIMVEFVQVVVSPEVFKTPETLTMPYRTAYRAMPADEDTRRAILRAVLERTRAL